MVALGRLDAAEATLADARWAIDGRSGTDGVAAQLDRAEAELLIARGDLDGAEVAAGPLGQGLSATSACGSTSAARC